jgi:hypothetical protein
MKGNQLFTRLGCEAADIAVAHSYSPTQRVFSVIEDANTLLTKIKAPAEAHDGGVLREVEKLTRSLMEAYEELR